MEQMTCGLGMLNVDAQRFFRAEFVFSPSVGSTSMMSQPMTNETIAVLTAHGITFPQTENPRPTTQTQASLKKRLNSEANVFGAIQILCGAMVLSLGIILAAAPAAPYFTTDFSTLIRSAYPFVGALCVSIVRQEGRM